jgi:hypothetical protein
MSRSFWKACAVTALAAGLVGAACSSSPKPAPKDANAAAKDGIIGAELLCAAREIGVSLGQVPPDADAAAQCARLKDAPEDASGAGGAR